MFQHNRWYEEADYERDELKEELVIAPKGKEEEISKEKKEIGW